MPFGTQVFAEASLSDFLESSRNGLRVEIDELGRDVLLGSEVPTLARELAEKHRVEPIVLGAAVIAEDGEKMVDVSHVPLRRRFGPGPHLGRVSFVVFAIPFEGDAEVLRFQPSHYYTVPPSAVLQGREVRVEVNSLLGGAAEMKAAFESTEREVRQLVEWANHDLAGHNKGLETVARKRIETRRAGILSHSEMVKGLGVPVATEAKAATTYSVGLIRNDAPGTRHPKEIDGGGATGAVQRPAVVPEPTLHMAEYEHVIEIMRKTGMAMERSPGSFEKMEETKLRDHLHVALNSHYDGTTTETFNCEGRTDILVRHKGENLFIGECKIWKGAKEVNGAIDQILRYTTWRDTKAALILFCRTRNLSSIMEQLPAAFWEHPNYARQDVEYRKEGALRFVMSHAGDPERKLIVTVLVFGIAKARKEEKPTGVAGVDIGFVD